MEKFLVSSCLLGISCRYDQKSKACEKVLKLFDKYELIPFCPEILGGLPTPRPAAEIVGNKVINANSQDVTKEFLKGTEETIKLAKIYKIKKAIVKSKSPSCGKGKIYDGSFSKVLIAGNGLTTQALLNEGIEVITEEEL